MVLVVMNQPLGRLPRHSWRNTLLCVACLAVAAFFVFDLRDWKSLGLVFVVEQMLKATCMVGAGVGLAFFLDVRGHWKALERVQSSAREIVWVYEHVLTRKSGASTSVERTLMIGFADGKRYGWALSAPLVELPAVRQFVASLPWATTGFSDELEASFTASPRSLVRSAAS